MLVVHVRVRFHRVYMQPLLGSPPSLPPILSLACPTPVLCLSIPGFLRFSSRSFSCSKLEKVRGRVVPVARAHDTPASCLVSGTSSCIACSFILRATIRVPAFFRLLLIGCGSRVAFLCRRCDVDVLRCVAHPLCIHACVHAGHIQKCRVIP